MNMLPQARVIGNIIKLAIALAKSLEANDVETATPIIRQVLRTIIPPISKLLFRNNPTIRELYTKGINWDIVAEIIAKYALKYASYYDLDEIIKNLRELISKQLDILGEALFQTALHFALKLIGLKMMKMDIGGDKTAYLLVGPRGAILTIRW